MGGWVLATPTKGLGPQTSRTMSAHTPESTSLGGDAGVTLRKATPQDLFNLPLYEHHLVIDIRSAEEYARGHIATAVSYPNLSLECPEEEREKSLVKFIRSYVKEYQRPENPSPVVLYGSERPECVFHAEWLAGRLTQLQKDRKMVVKFEPPKEQEVGEPFNHFEHFCLTIADRAQEIWILEGGYDAFQLEYEFLCGDVDFTAMFPLPHQISKNLLLGTRMVPLTKDCLSKLQISHIILSEYQNVNWKELQGIEVLRCSVQEFGPQDMFPCWSACTEFITEAVATSPNARIMVILFGRSRSTSVIIAYLIKALRMHFEDAWKFVCSKCWHRIDRSLIYEDQLRVWEQTETASIAYEDKQL